jgi:hypothetical protein
MSKSGARLGFLIVTLSWCGWMLFTSPSSATLDMQKQAKAAGVDAKNCQTCHVDKLPKKDAHELNDAGKWLVAEKEKRGAKAADGAWLKDYPKK